MSYALITGASSGLGKEFARLFAAQGIPLILTSSPRSEHALHEVARTLRSTYANEVLTISCDLADPMGASTLIDAIENRNLTVTYLVNNAGFGICGYKVQDYDPKKFKEMLIVNINALSELIAHFLPKMVARKHGKILNVSSISGYIYPHGLEAAYSASKAYVVSLSEGLVDDLRGTGVTCTHLAPGATATQFFNTSGLINQSRVTKMYMQPDVVAKKGFDAMMQGKPRVMPGFSNKLLKYAALFSPSRRWVGKLSGAVLK